MLRLIDVSVTSQQINDVTMCQHKSLKLNYLKEMY